MFAKILNSEELGQILLIKEYDLESEMDTIRICVKPLNLGVCEATMRLDCENDRDNAFDSITLETLPSLVGDIFKINDLLI